MPELPEVETIARILRQGGQDSPPIVGHTVEAVDVLWERTLAEPSPAEFRQRITGQQIEDTGRRGKYLLFQLNRDTLLFHLRMSGDLLVSLGTHPACSHARLVLYLDGGVHICFNDPRKFGRIWLLADPTPLFTKLGPEPFDPEFSTEIFHQKLRARKRQIKPLLLDQSFMAGMGNIYTDEALFLAHIHPLTPADTLDDNQAAALLSSIRRVLRTGIQRNGASIDWVYRGGDFQNELQVYRRTGLPCRECQTPVERIIAGQRSTHFCPTCQSLSSISLD